MLRFRVRLILVPGIVRANSLCERLLNSRDNRLELQRCITMSMLAYYVQEILQLSIPEEHRNTVGGTDTVLYSFDGVLRDDATQEVGIKVR